MLTVDFHADPSGSRPGVEISHEVFDGKPGAGGYGAFVVLGMELRDGGRVRIYVDADDGGEKFLADLAAGVFNAQKAIAAKRAEAERNARLAERERIEAEMIDPPTVELSAEEVEQARATVKELADQFAPDLGAPVG